MCAPTGQVVDHKYHNTLDNRKDKLRITTHAENSFNRRGASTNSISGIRGVSWDKQRDKWKAKAVKERKQYFFGCYDDIIDAVYAVAAGRNHIYRPEVTRIPIKA
jgi:hypothetical protein